MHNAIETAKIAAASICGKPGPTLDVPWFCSNQYDLKMQTVGLLTGFDQAILRGDMAARKFSVWYLGGNRILAVDAVNAPADFMAAKRLVGKPTPRNPDMLRDPAADLRQLLALA